MITAIGANICRYMWQHSTQYKDCFVSINNCDLPIEIISHGVTYEEDNDVFIAAKVVVESVTYAGAVVMHSSPAMYEKWNNSVDSKSYFASIHVVGILKSDAIPLIYSPKNGIVIFVIIPEMLFKRYFTISNSQKAICGNYYNSLSQFSRAHIADSYFIERLNNKCKHIEDSHNVMGKNWLNTLMFAIFDSIQISTRNRRQFNLLLKEIKYYMVIQSLNSIESVEALLLGTAGLLVSDYPDEYLYVLRKEYDRLSKTYELKRLNTYHWDISSKNSISIYTLFAQLSAIIFHNKTLIYDLVESNSIKLIKNLFEKDISEYWLKHYEFGVFERKELKHKRLSSKRIDLLLINGILPFVALYSRKENMLNNDMDSIIGYYMSIEPEDNTIVNEWVKMGIDMNSALDSQAFIEIHKNYCNANKCWKCVLGKKLLSQSESAL